MSPSPPLEAAPASRRATYGLWLRRHLPGLGLAAGVGAASVLIAQWTPAWSALIWAILIGTLLTNLLPLPAAVQPGVTFAAKQLLRLAVGLLGLRLGLSEVLEVGPTGLLLVLVAVAGTFAFSVWIGRRMGLSSSLSTVLAAGTSICGASAIVAVAGVINAKDEETAIGVGTVTLYGTLAMFIYPVVGQLLGMTPEAFGLWAGASIHEVAQVIAAGFAFDAASAAGASVEIATVVKLGRVLMLAPVTILLSLSFRNRTGAGAARGAAIPWFVLLFIATMVLRSIGVLPEQLVGDLVRLDGVLLAVAMAGLGLDLRWAKVRAAGIKPLYTALLATLFISLTTLGLVSWLA